MTIDWLMEKARHRETVYGSERSQGPRPRRAHPERACVKTLMDLCLRVAIYLLRDLDKSLNIPGPWFPPLHNGSSNTHSSRGCKS